MPDRIENGIMFEASTCKNTSGLLAPFLINFLRLRQIEISPRQVNSHTDCQNPLGGAILALLTSKNEYIFCRTTSA